MSDTFLAASLRSAHLAAGVAITTATCRAAQDVQKLSSTSAVALGRLLTAAALCSNIRQQHGALSLQIVGSGRLGQLFADITPEGDLRGYVKNPSLAFPLSPDEAVRGRRLVSPAVGEGTLAVMRLGAGTSYSHSTTELVSGDIDRDVEHYLSASEQVPTVLACEVVLDERSRVSRAGGVIVQALPDGDRSLFAELARTVKEGALAPLLDAAQDDPHELLSSIVPDATPLDSHALRWRCRCTPERVRGALGALDLVDLADMVQKRETAAVNCHFCGKDYSVGPEELQSIYTALIKHRS